MINTATATPQTQAKWTILVYSAADNNLTPYMVDDIKEIETVGSDAYTNLVAQVDQGGDVGAARYLLEKSSNPSEISSPKLQDMGSMNMSDPNQLADFIKWGVESYPAEHYMVVISDHGDGWNGAVQDVSHDGWMTPGMIREGFEKAQAATGKKIDVLGMDACLMASTEFAHEMKDVADYLVVSEQTEGADGWNYSKILNPEMLNNLKSMQMMKINVEPRDLAVLGVTSAEAHQETLPTMSAIDTSKMPALTEAVGKFGQAIVASETSGSVFKDIARNTQSFYGYKDLGDFSKRVQDNCSANDPVREAAYNTEQALKEAVIAEQHSDTYPGASGLTIELPTWGGVPSNYTNLQFDQATQWSQALDKITSSN